MTDNPAITHLLALATRTLGHRAELATPDPLPATGTVVRIRSGDTEVIGKIHRSRSLHDQEVHAYRNWAPHLGSAAPHLLAADRDLPGILLSLVPGDRLDTVDLDASPEQAAHHDAGIVLRRLHQIEVSTPASDITRYLADRAEYWIDQAGDQLTPPEANVVHDHVRRLLAVADPRPAVCHLDFQPRNLLWHHEYGIRVIDFENSREDLAARDLVRLATRVWPHRPDLKEAFLSGYGLLTDTDEAVLGCTTAIEAVTSLVYGLRTGEAWYRDHARNLLDQLAGT